MKILAGLLSALAVMVAFEATAWPCSVFTAHDDQTVLAANNEDYYGGDPTLIWFVPPEADKYGYVAYGYESNHFSQGGMNDQGLFWDGLATVTLECTQCTGQQPFTLTTLEEVMQDSATVQEAIDNLMLYAIADVMEAAQLIFVDANGDSAIVEGDQIIWPAHDYQIATNFYQSDPGLGGYPCWRYDTLESLMESGPELTVDEFRQMADAVHQGSAPGPDVYTRYTTIGDLKNGLLYLFHDMDFGSCLRFDLAEELAQPAHEVSMADLTYEPACWEAAGGGGAGGSAGAGGVGGPGGGVVAGGGQGGAGATPAVQPEANDGGCGCRVGAHDEERTLGWLLLVGLSVAGRLKQRTPRVPCRRGALRPAGLQR